MNSLPEWCGDRGNDTAKAPGARLRFLGLVAAVALGSSGAEGQVAIEVDSTEAEAGPVDNAAPDAPEDDNQAVPAAADAPLTPEAMARQQIEQMAAQYEPMLTRVLQDDLELLRTLHGDLPVEARRAIVAAGEKGVKEGALRFSAAMQAPQSMPGVPPPPANVGIFNFVGRVFGFPVDEAPARRADEAGNAGAEEAPVDPCQVVRDAVAGSLVGLIGEERGADFRDELSRREERHRAMIVRRIVGVLDDDLFLSAKQREAIEAAIAAEWDDEVAMAIDHRMEFNGRRIYPGLPYEQVLPLLTPPQRERLGNSDQAGEITRSNRQMMLQSRFFRRANLSQQAERDPWWFE